MRRGTRRLSIIQFWILGSFLVLHSAVYSQGKDELRRARAMMSVHGNVRLGQSFAPAEVKELEEKLAKDPGNVELRGQLVGYYGDYRHWQDAPRRAKYHHHVLWLIRNDPETPLLGTPYSGMMPFRDGDAYGEGKKAWLEQVEKSPENPIILEHASRFLTLHDREIAIDLMETMAGVEPENPSWHMKLGHLYELEMRGRDGINPALAGKAVTAYEAALKHLRRDMRVANVLQSLAKAAYAAERFDLAKTCAKRLVDEFATSRNAPSSIHFGSTILGRLAVRGGEVDAAKEHLLISGRIGGDPSLSSFGPSMALAKDLLELEEWDVVGEYLDLCAKFWNTPRASERLEKWKGDIEAKRLPDFGGNAAR